MSRDYDVEQKIIDDYYQQRENAKASENWSHELSEDDFEKKLRLSMDKMDMLDQADFELDINIMGIIAEGEKIRDRKKEKKELIGFIGLAMGLMAIMAVLCTSFSPKIFIYWQIAVFTLIPLSLIPMALMAGKREEV